MKGAKVEKIVLNEYGSFLGMDKGSFLVRDRKGSIERYPLFQRDIGEIRIVSGNTISSGALSSLCFWNIPLMITTRKGRPIGILKSLNDDSHVKTRLCQYQALSNGKGIEIAKKLIVGKIKGQNLFLNKHGLMKLDYSFIERINSIQETDIVKLRPSLMNLEGRCATKYYSEMYKLFPDWLRPTNRITYQAFDGLNNLFNLAYELLKWHIQVALVNSHLESYLGFLHSIQYNKPSLVCDFEELYRFLVDDFVVRYCKTLTKKDFCLKTEKQSDKKGKREYLNDKLTGDFTSKLNDYFCTRVSVSRINIKSKGQELESLIFEETQLFAKFLRGERTHWEPRIASLQ